MLRRFIPNRTAPLKEIEGRCFGPDKDRPSIRLRLPHDENRVRLFQWSPLPTEQFRRRQRTAVSAQKRSSQAVPVQSIAEPNSSGAGKVRPAASAQTRSSQAIPCRSGHRQRAVVCQEHPSIDGFRQWNLERCIEAGICPTVRPIKCVEHAKKSPLPLHCDRGDFIFGSLPKFRKGGLFPGPTLFPKLGNISKPGSTTEARQHPRNQAAQPKPSNNPESRQHSRNLTRIPAAQSKPRKHPRNK